MLELREQLAHAVTRSLHKEKLLIKHVSTGVSW